jgi:hypothetical protein
MATQPTSKKPRRKPLRPSAVAEDASKAVWQAASVLESELASGLAGVRKLETRFTGEHHVDQKEFDNVLEQLRSSAHEFIDVAASRMGDVRSAESHELTQRLAADGHDLSDMMINLLGMAPDIVNRLVARAEAAAPAPDARKRAAAKKTPAQKPARARKPK